LPTRAVTARTLQQGAAGGYTYTLQDIGDSSHAPMETLNCKGTSWWENAETIQDPSNDNEWLTAEMSALSLGGRGALDAHWGLQMTLNYWRSRHKWRSFDNQGTKVVNYINYHKSVLDLDGNDLPQTPNAYWSTVYPQGHGAIFFENGNQRGSAATDLGTVGHEFGHGVKGSTARFFNDGIESGPLNEGFSDIWGTCVRAYANDSLGTGFNVWTGPRNPVNLAGYPKYYKGDNWSYTQQMPGDNASYNHRNSTVLYYWFYLLAVGGTGPNEKGEDYCVPAVGIRAMEQIAFATEKLLANPAGGSSNTYYADVRDKSLVAAAALYGSNSVELRAVQEAWYAVGVGPKRPDYTTYSIAAPAWSCTTTSGTFTLATSSTAGLALPVADWTISPAGVVTSTPTTGVNQLTITQIPGRAGILSITATIPKNCGNTNQTVLTFPQLIVGNPAPSGIQGEYNTPPRRIKATINPVPTATSYDWYVNGTLQSTHGITITANIRNLNSCDDPEIIEVQAQFGSCGASQMVQRYFYPLNCGSARTSASDATTATAYPNPAAEALTLPADVTGATLLDSQGKDIRKANGATRLEVRDLPNGLYNLQMWQQGKLVNQRIQVQH
jgi:hypothetical protein